MKVLSYAVPAVQATAEVAKTVQENQEKTSKSQEIKRKYEDLLKEREEIVIQLETLKTEVAAERRNLLKLNAMNEQLANKIHFFQTLLVVSVMTTIGLLIALFSGYL